VFYAWWRLDFLALLILTTVWTYVTGLFIQRHPVKSAASRRYLAIGLALNIGVLAYFKYFNFGIAGLNALFSSIGIPAIDAWEVILPIGISFYIFQAVSYLVDVYRGDAPPAGSYFDLAAFVSLFPQLIAGPILRYKQLAHQFRRRNHTFAGFASGTVRFMRGFVKKILIADTVAVIADAAFALAEPSFADAWLGAIAFAVQLYFDFSGYSDMAIGLGRMIGFEFPENFDAPYRSKSITEFWRRWHISLSTWLRDYLYIPLGGNRKGTARTYGNLMLVMALGGLWHGASINFLLWGVFHGLLLAYERSTGRRRSRLPSGVAVPRTMMLVVLGWVLFRSPDIASALSMYRGMFGFGAFALSDPLAWQVSRLSVAALVAGLVALYWPKNILSKLASRVKGSIRLPTARIPVIAGGIGIFLLGVLKMIADSYSPFLYFQF
jgi:alginate O-acetyltransferase complex protein AlgI